MGAVVADPAVKRTPGVAARAAVGVDEDTTGQLAHQPASFGRGQTRVQGLHDHAVAEQRDLLEAIGGLGCGHGASRDGDQGTGASQRRPPGPAQGGGVVAASHPPPLATAANPQRPGTCPPGPPERCRRWHAHAQAAPSATSAAASGSAGNTGATPPNSTASAANPAASAGALARKRRRQSRAVEWGTPSAWATGRNPAPATGPSSTNAGSRAWVTRQEGHLARRTQTRYRRPA